MRTRHPGRRSLLRNRAFLILWAGLLVSSAGDWVNYVAMVAVVYSETHSPVALAALRLFHIIPILLIAPVAGAFVDRWRRRRVLILSPLAAGVSVAILVGYHPVWMVFAGYGGLTIALTFFNPALAAVIPAIVAPEDLVAANSLTQITATSSIVVGGLAGGALVAGLGPSWAFGFDAASFLVVAIAVLWVPVSEAAAAVAPGRLLDEVRDGARYLKEQPLVANVVLSSAVFVFAPATVLTLGVAYVHTSFHGGSAEYGLLLAGLGVGSVAGAGLLVAWRPRRRQEVAFAAGGIALGVATALMGVMPNVALAAAMYGLAGCAGMVSTVSAVTLLQEVVPDQLRGRIFAASATLDHAGAFGSTLLIGLAAGLAGAAAIITAAGALAGTAGVLSLYRVQALRQNRTRRQLRRG